MNISGIFKGFAYLTSVSLSISAYSWWDQTHQMIGFIASENVTPETYEKAEKLLQVAVPYPGSNKLSVNTSDFDTVGSWADSIKGYSGQETAISHRDCHFTDILMDESQAGTEIPYQTAEQELRKSLAARPVNSTVCLKSAIKTLMLTTTTQQQKAIALRFVIHIVGDIGQPLHNISKIHDHTDDRGGNGTVFPSTIWIPTTSGSSSSQTKLHAVWDGTLGRFIQFPYSFATMKEGIFSAEDRLINQHLAENLQKTDDFQKILDSTYNTTQTIEDWIIDGYQIAAKFAYADLSESWGTYSVFRYNIVNSQIIKSSARLAHLLDAIFDPQNSSLAFQEIVYNIKKDRKIKPFILQ